MTRKDDFGTHADAAARAVDRLQQRRKRFEEKETRILCWLRRTYGPTLVENLLKPKMDPKTKRAPCCFCGKYVQVNSDVLCPSCKDKVDQTSGTEISHFDRPQK